MKRRPYPNYCYYETAAMFEDVPYSIDLSSETEIRDYPALRLIGIRREIMTFEGLATEVDLTAEQREQIAEEIALRVAYLGELETALNALYDLDRDRENDPGLEDTPLSKYIAERKRRLMDRLLEAQGVPCPDRSRGPSETDGV